MLPLDVDTRKLIAEERVESLRASVGRRPLGRFRARLRLPFAAPELEPAPRALPGAVHPAHVGAATPARLGRSHLVNLGEPADVPCYTRSSGAA